MQSFFSKRCTVSHTVKKFGLISGAVENRIFFSRGPSNSTGVLIAFRKGLNYRTESTFRDLEGHFLILKAVLQDSPVILINYYVPNDESSQVRVLLEINRIFSSLKLEQNMSIIWGRWRF